MEDDKPEVISDNRLLKCDRNYEEEKENELVTLIANIIVDKVLR